MTKAEEDALYDLKDAELREALRPKLTDEFLTTLVDAVNTCGWNVDLIETASFVDWCFEAVGKSPPSVKAYLNP